MVRSRLTFLILVGIAWLATGVAHAADYSPPPVYVPPPPPQECCDSWYLRGFVGVGMNGKYDIDSNPIPTTGSFVANSISDSVFLGAGIGYEFNNWLRFEGTAEYRSRARISALGSYTSGPATFVDEFEGYLKSYIFLANAFVDLGTWECFTPFVGAGIGGAYNVVSDFNDVSPTVPNALGSSFGIGRGGSSWSMAWALYAGVSYNVSKNFKVDLTYRYLNYGSAADTIDCNGGCGGTDFTFKNLHSQDIMLGLRWTCCDVPTPPRYVYQPPQPVYSPPPQYIQPAPVYQPPLRSKG